ncbi:MAG: hypothetical protein WBP41_08220, partial [Saprospiraceae bacterium]
MKIILIPFLIFLHFQFVYSQKSSFAFECGLSFPNRYSPKIPDFDYISKKNRKTTFTPGFEFKYSFIKHLSLKTGMFYDERGWYASIFTLDPNTGATETNVRTNFLYSFLTFPTVIE